MKSISTVLFFSLVVLSCSHREKATLQKSKGIAQEGLEGSHYTALDFDQGRSDLNDANKSDLNKLAQRALRTGRDVSEIKILAWADREYPGRKNERVKTRDIILANERARVTREFIRQDLRSKESIDVFNMAKKPGPIDKITKNEEFQVKEDIARSGVSGTRLASGDTSYTKAGKVLVIIEYRESEPK